MSYPLPRSIERIVIDAVLTNVQIAVMGRVLTTQTVCMNVQVIWA
jgi:hypothetical protein